LDAEFEYAQALSLETSEQTNIEIARTLEGLAELQCICGNYSHAEPLYQRALAIRERGATDKNPDFSQVEYAKTLKAYELCLQRLAKPPHHGRY
jgi:hypothetical protein